VQIVFDPGTLHQSKMGSITGVVYFDFGSGRQFPAAGWNDFVVVVSGWWLAAVHDLDRGSVESVLHFMDGPYWINAVADGPRVLLRCTGGRAHSEVLHYEVLVEMEELRHKLTAFAMQVSKACTKANIKSADLDGLRTQLPH
jgi:hypothetical protein